MNLIINGDSRQVDNVSTVEQLLAEFELQQKILVVEVNKKIIERTNYDATELHEGDSIEIVHFVGGG